MLKSLCNSHSSGRCENLCERQVSQRVMYSFSKCCRTNFSIKTIKCYVFVGFSSPKAYHVLSIFLMSYTSRHFFLSLIKFSKDSLRRILAALLKKKSFSFLSFNIILLQFCTQSQYLMAVIERFFCLTLSCVSYVVCLGKSIVCKNELVNQVSGSGVKLLSYFYLLHLSFAALSVLSW